MYIKKANKLARVKRILFDYGFKVNERHLIDSVNPRYVQIPIGCVEDLIYELAEVKKLDR